MKLLKVKNRISTVNWILDKLKAGSGAVLFKNIDPNDTMRILAEIVANTSIGVSGVISIDYFVNR